MLYSTRLKALRERIGLTQKEAGLLLDLDSGTYCHYEQEDLIIPVKHLNTLANYFHVSIDYLFNLTDTISYKDCIEEIDKYKAGIRLKEFRKKVNITQNKLAIVLNTTQGVIANYERGRTVIATPFLYTICNKYKVSADYLLGKIDEEIKI